MRNPIRILASKFGSKLSRAQKAFFQEYGYLHLEQILSEEFLNRVQLALEKWVDDTIRDWKKQKLLAEDFRDFDFNTRLYKAWLASSKPTLITASLDESLLSPRFRNLLSEEKLSSIARQLLDSNDVIPLDYSFFRAKLPEQNYTSVPWHQDAQCLASPNAPEYLTLWIPLIDMHEGNSCLEIADAHLDRGIYKSCTPPGALYVGMRGRDIDHLANKRKVLMKRGDILCMHKFLPHRSGHNESEQVRWSIDIRYRPY